MSYSTRATIIHVDINSYFASLLQQENPALRGKPLGVLKDVGRTCLIATSKEAKKIGIKTGANLIEAQERCRQAHAQGLIPTPDITYVPVSFDRCLDATRRLRQIFTTIAPNIYIYSLDEAFIDVTDCLHYLYPSPQAVAAQIKRRISAELGEWVTCSIGISHNRLLAKLASEVTPPDTVMTITPDNLDQVLASVPLKSVCGLGYHLSQKLHRLGVTTPYQIRFLDQETLAGISGPFWAEHLQRIAYGEEPHFLTLLDSPNEHLKSVSRSITGYHTYADEDDIRHILLNLTEEVTHKTRKMQLAGRQVGLSLNGYGQDWSDHQTLARPISHTTEMFGILYEKLYRSWQRSFPIIKFMVRLSLLQPIDTVQPSLFGENNWERVSPAVDALNERYGLFTVRPATLTRLPLIRPEVTGFLGDRTYYEL